MFLSAIKVSNLALAFFLELAVLVALGYWGFFVGQGALGEIGLGIGAPLVAVVVWALFGAPRSAWRLQGFGFLLLRVIFFGSASVALFVVSQHVLSIAFAIIVVLNLALVYLWEQLGAIKR